LAQRKGHRYADGEPVVNETFRFRQWVPSKCAATQVPVRDALITTGQLP
jgi:hypothetical protein